MEESQPRVVVVCGGRGGIKTQTRLKAAIDELEMVLSSDETKDHNFVLRPQERHELDCVVIDPQFHRPANRKGKHKRKKAWDSPYGV